MPRAKRSSYTKKREGIAKPRRVVEKPVQQHDGGAVGEAEPFKPHRSVKDLVDSYAGADSERVIQALATIALGNGASRVAFFGEPFKVTAKDRNVALAQLALRRWGRPGIHVEVNPEGSEVKGTQIVNIFASDPEAEDYAEE